MRYFSRASSTQKDCPCSSSGADTSRKWDLVIVAGKSEKELLACNTNIPCVYVILVCILSSVQAQHALAAGNARVLLGPQAILSPKCCQTKHRAPIQTNKQRNKKKEKKKQFHFKDLGIGA